APRRPGEAAGRSALDPQAEPDHVARPAGRRHPHLRARLAAVNATAPDLPRAAALVLQLHAEVGPPTVIERAAVQTGPEAQLGLRRQPQAVAEDRRAGLRDGPRFPDRDGRWSVVLQEVLERSVPFGADGEAVEGGGQ